MVISLLLAATILFQSPASLPLPPAKHSCHHCHHHCLPDAGNAVTAIKGDIQFAMVVPPPLPHQDPPPRPFDTPAQEEREEQTLITTTNAERVQRGLEPLTADPLLTETARAHSREMCELAYFDHVSPKTGLTMPMDRYLRALREWGQDQPVSAIVGENLFYCSATTDFYNVSYAHRSLMESPGHRANILEPRFTKIGVGLYRDSLGRFWVTEMFLRDTAVEP